MYRNRSSKSLSRPSYRLRSCEDGLATLVLPIFSPLFPGETGPHSSGAHSRTDLLSCFHPCLKFPSQALQTRRLPAGGGGHPLAPARLSQCLRKLPDNTYSAPPPSCSQFYSPRRYAGCLAMSLRCPQAPRFVVGMVVPTVHAGQILSPRPCAVAASIQEVFRESRSGG